MSFYQVALIQEADYYPFGMVMPERNKMDGKYRYGYNGMEMDNETKGIGNSYTTEFRQYDPRLGRWLSLDPLMAKYPMMSPYVAFNNNPIFFIDPLGLEGKPVWTTIDEGWQKIDVCAECNPGSNSSTSTNIIKALERTNMGGEMRLGIGHPVLGNGYIHKNSYIQNKYYTNTYETEFRNELNRGRDYQPPENYIFKDKVTNSFVIRGKYIYHKQVKERTFIYFDYSTGETYATSTTRYVVEQKQYFTSLYSDNDYFALDSHEFYQRKIRYIGDRIKGVTIPITKAMEEQIEIAVKYYFITTLMQQELERQAQSTQDYINETIQIESEERILPPPSFKLPSFMKRKK